MEHKPGRFVDVELIRPLEWIEEEDAAVGEVIWLELPEMHAAGDAEVLAISACPALETGSGPVITGTFRHEADELVEIRVSGQPDPLRCTEEHPFWSATRHEFVAARALRPGEEFETSTGTPALLTSITPRAGPETVYGLEVYGEHVYHVSPAGLLVQNASMKNQSAYRSLNDEDIANLQSGQGIRRSGAGSLAETILDSKRTKFIPTTEDFGVVQKYGDTKNYIRFRTHKIPAGQYMSQEQILSNKLLRR